VEIQKTIVSLNILNTKLDLSEGKSFILVEIGERHFHNTSLEVIRSDLGTLGLGNQGASAILLGKDGWSNKLVPFLLGKGVDRLFTASLLGLCQSLILTLLVVKRKENNVRYRYGKEETTMVGDGWMDSTRAAAVVAGQRSSGTRNRDCNGGQKRSTMTASCCYIYMLLLSLSVDIVPSPCHGCCCWLVAC
jgi:hypothetical protein